MGRTLTNTMVNLGIQGECDEAMYQVMVCLFCFSDCLKVVLSMLHVGHWVDCE